MGNRTTAGRSVAAAVIAAVALLAGSTAISSASSSPQRSTVAQMQAPGVDATVLVTASYQGLLGRAPEPAGLAYWVGRIEDGVSPRELVTQLARSREHAHHVVATAYRTFLLREPDAGGVQWWADHLETTRSLTSLRAELISSPEYYATRAGRSPSGFVTQVYQDVLGRAPDVSGQQYWESLLAAGTSRRAVARAILVSNEGFLLSDLPVQSVSPRPNERSWGLNIEVDVATALVSEGTTVLVSVDGQPLAGAVQVEGSAIRFVPDRLPLDRVPFGSTADVIVTVLGYHGDRVDRFDYGFTYRAPVAVSSFSTPLQAGQDRNTNIARAAELIDGQVIRSGEDLSLNAAIGERTLDRGFVENGFILGGETTEAVGGGVSQVATTFLNAAWLAGIEIDSFRPHSIYFPRYPMCREATIVWDALDLVVTNDSPHDIIIDAGTTSTDLTITFYSVPWATVESWTGEPYNTDLVGGPFRVDCGRDITYPNGNTASEQYTWGYNAGFPG